MCKIVVIIQLSAMFFFLQHFTTLLLFGNSVSTASIDREAKMEHIIISYTYILYSFLGIFLMSFSSLMKIYTLKKYKYRIIKCFQFRKCKKEQNKFLTSNCKENSLLYYLQTNIYMRHSTSLVKTSSIQPYVHKRE